MFWTDNIKTGVSLIIIGLIGMMIVSSVVHNNKYNAIKDENRGLIRENDSLEIEANRYEEMYEEQLELARKQSLWADEVNKRMDSIKTEYAKTGHDIDAANDFKSLDSLLSRFYN